MAGKTRRKPNAKVKGTSGSANGAKAKKPKVRGGGRGVAQPIAGLEKLNARKEAQAAAEERAERRAKADGTWRLIGIVASAACVVAIVVTLVIFLNQPDGGTTVIDGEETEVVAEGAELEGMPTSLQDAMSRLSPEDRRRAERDMETLWRRIPSISDPKAREELMKKLEESMRWFGELSLGSILAYVLQQQADQNADNPIFLCIWGMVQAMMPGREAKERGLRDIRKAIELAPDFDYARYAFAAIIIQSQDRLNPNIAEVEEAVRILEQISPDHASGQRALALGYMMLRQREKAIEAVEVSIGQRPSDEETWQALLSIIFYGRTPGGASLPREDAERLGRLVERYRGDLSKDIELGIYYLLIEFVRQQLASYMQRGSTGDAGLSELLQRADRYLRRALVLAEDPDTEVPDGYWAALYSMRGQIEAFKRNYRAAFTDFNTAYERATDLPSRMQVLAMYAGAIAHVFANGEAAEKPIAESVLLIQRVLDLFQEDPEEAGESDEPNAMPTQSPASLAMMRRVTQGFLVSFLLDAGGPQTVPMTDEQREAVWAQLGRPARWQLTDFAVEVVRESVAGERASGPDREWLEMLGETLRYNFDITTPDGATPGAMDRSALTEDRRDTLRAAMETLIEHGFDGGERARSVTTDVLGPLVRETGIASERFRAFLRGIFLDAERESLMTRACRMLVDAPDPELARALVDAADRRLASAIEPRVVQSFFQEAHYALVATFPDAGQPSSWAPESANQRGPYDAWLRTWREILDNQ